ncbi:MAG: hypothetical protein IPK53_10385 [bacterium]|nr:hypothetical protein [bacterium]
MEIFTETDGTRPLPTNSPNSRPRYRSKQSRLSSQPAWWGNPTTPKRFGNGQKPAPVPPGTNGKKYDDTFNQVLDNTWSIAHNWQTQQATDAIERASTLLQLAAPTMAQGVITLASGKDERGRLVKHADRLRALLAALDRASSTTAPKGQMEVRGLEEALARIYGEEEDEEGEDSEA